MNKVLIRCNRRRMVAVFPKRTLTTLPAIVLLSNTSSQQLHARRNLLLAAIPDEQVHVIRGNDIVQYRKAVSFARFKEPVNPAFAIPAKLEQKFSLVATMRDVPDVAWQYVPVCSCHSPLPYDRSLQYISFMKLTGVAPSDRSRKIQAIDLHPESLENLTSLLNQGGHSIRVKIQRIRMTEEMPKSEKPAEVAN